MAYQISYHYKEIKKEKIKKISRFTYVLAVVGLMAALVSTQIGGSALDILLMGDKEQVQYAAQEMVESIRNGSTVDGAVAVFCRELSQ